MFVKLKSTGVKAGYFPSSIIVARIKNQLIAQSYTTVIDGIGLWSFVRRCKATPIIFDHVAEDSQGEEMLARSFHWERLIENLAAVSERRPPPFVGGQDTPRALPGGFVTPRVWNM